MTSGLGLFCVQLGSPPTAPLPDTLFADTIASLGIKFGTDPMMNPRTRLVSVPFAQHARAADSISSDIYIYRYGDTLNGLPAVAGNFSDMHTSSLDTPRKESILGTGTILANPNYSGRVADQLDPAVSGHGYFRKYSDQN